MTVSADCDADADDGGHLTDSQSGADSQGCYYDVTVVDSTSLVELSPPRTPRHHTLPTSTTQSNHTVISILFIYLPGQIVLKLVYHKYKCQTS